MSSLPNPNIATRWDRDFIFRELTRSICPVCKRVIDAEVIMRNNKVYIRKRCPDHGRFEGLVSSDAQMCLASAALTLWDEYDKDDPAYAEVKP